MSPDVLAILTNHFEESLVRAIMYRGKNNYEQKKIIRALKTAYRNWKKDTDILWGAMPYMETYPDFLERMKVDVECGMLITEGGSISVTLKKPFKAPYVSATALRQHIAGTKAIESPDISKYESRIKELEAENEQLKANIKDKDAEIASLKQQLDEERQKQQNIIDDFSGLDEVQRMRLHQKIVFFTTVTSVLLDKRYTNMRNFASFIASMCNEKPKTIGPMLSRIGQITEKDPNTQLSATLHSAAQCVSDMLKQILTDVTKNDKAQIINKIRDNLLLNYPSPEDE